MTTRPAYTFLHHQAFAGGRVGSTLLIAGDGIYATLDACQMTIPYPLLLCEIRGLAPLFPWILGSTEPISLEAEPTAFVPLPLGYHLLTEESSQVPPLDPGHIFAYVIAQNGVFLHAQSDSLEVLMPIASGELPGLVPTVPYAQSRYPLVGEDLVMEMLHAAQNARDADGHPVECLFSLTWNGAWAWHLPAQEQTATSVRVLEDSPSILEGHSHHGMRAYFSSTDDVDEIINGGFCPYFVLGHVHSAPEIVMRICAHGYAWNVPAGWFFALPASVTDRGLWTEER